MGDPTEDIDNAIVNKVKSYISCLEKAKTSGQITKLLKLNVFKIYFGQD
ncbi:conserved hypothetical protein [Zunongwangia profunda SM-A87]|uniref:Uncharacterized protein n=2 Tax=Flavobacteriaceae TaxID=49546 RepID=A3XIX5_LEEBM|nr:conserved hypothetical protein [Zunongwangia profunda SM-A87]EAQ50496.1 hypothetical protein MED217_05672 [Leeuwenhoekiella blandensis MED217]